VATALVSVTGSIDSTVRRARAAAFVLSVLCLACAWALCLCSSAQATVARSGTLQATVVENLRTGESTTRYALEAGEREIPLLPTVLTAAPGDRVVVTGNLRDGRMIGQVEAVTASAEPMALAEPRKVAVLLVTFAGHSAAPWSAEEARSKVFTAADSANAFYEEESHGGISLTGKLDEDGDVFGWFELDTPTAGCPYATWKEEADAAAVAGGVDLTGYQHVVYFFPQQVSCSWNGVAGVHSDWSMINGNLGVKTISHELGHNLGLRHAGSWTCTAGGTRVPISDTCSTNQYGDPFDTQGNISTRHHNGWNLAKLGVLTPENIETVDADGTYSLRSALHPTAEPTVLRIPRERTLDGEVTSWYYLEVRETGGVFENVVDASTSGVSIRATTENVSPETRLLDANPASSTFGDAPLGVGQTFDGGSVSIATLAAGGGSATVSVELDDEPPSAPTGVMATIEAGGVRLRWDASSDNAGVDRYVVFRDGVEIGATDETDFLDDRVSVGDHAYVVYAEDETRNRSAASESAVAPVPAVAGPTCAGGLCTVTFRHSGAASQWIVPPGVGEAEFTVLGARGGNEGLNLGARVVAKLGPLTAGQEVAVSAGGMGEPYDADAMEGGAGGFNGGGDGTFGAGGGGFSKVEIDSTLMLLAGGGGGRGASGFNAVTEQSPAGGAGGRGGSIGTNAFNGGVANVHGASLRGGQGGMAGGNGGASGTGGAVTGTSTCPGGASAGAPGAAGASFAGGGGAADAGGGGGGGYAGGGQGGGGARDACGSTAGAGGGGGGSSYAAPGLLAEFTGGAWGGDGQVSIAYSNPVDPADRSYTTARDQELVVPAASGVLSGAPGPSGVPLSASLVSPPASGSLTLDDDGSFTYVPDSGYLGLDFFTYRVTDPSGHSATARVTMRVAARPSASIFAPLPGGTYVAGQSVPTAFSCSEGAAGTGLLSCDDSSGANSVGGGAGHLDTSTVGHHSYTVTAVSKTGLTDSTSIDYAVVPAPPEPPAPQPPKGPKDPSLRVSLSIERESLRKLLRTGKVVVAARVNEAAKVKLTGRARSAAVFKTRAVRFAAAGEKKVRLVLTRKGRKALRGLRKVRLVIAARATDPAGETARKQVALTLRR
jgi:hypothetical protein